MGSTENTNRLYELWNKAQNKKLSQNELKEALNILASNEHNLTGIERRNIEGDLQAGVRIFR